MVLSFEGLPNGVEMVNESIVVELNGVLVEIVWIEAKLMGEGVGNRGDGERHPWRLI